MVRSFQGRGVNSTQVVCGYLLITANASSAEMTCFTPWSSRHCTLSEPFTMNSGGTRVHIGFSETMIRKGPPSAQYSLKNCLTLSASQALHLFTFGSPGKPSTFSRALFCNRNGRLKSMPYLLPALARKHSFITIMICLL